MNTTVYNAYGASALPFRPGLSNPGQPTYASVSPQVIPQTQYVMAPIPLNPTIKQPFYLKPITPDRIQAYKALQARRAKMKDTIIGDPNPALNSLAKLAARFQNTLTVPGAIWRGLKGDPNYTFSDVMLVSRVPFFIGGAMLAAGFAAGGNIKEFTRQASAVLMYIGGAVGTSWAINTLYRLRYGVDLTMLYRSQTGQLEQVYASSDFPRFDLLSDEQYKKLARKMKISDDVYEQDGAVREQLRNIITGSRALKIISGSILSALGAGYMARTDTWTHFATNLKALPSHWTAWWNPLTFPGSLNDTRKTLWEGLKPVLQDRLVKPFIKTGDAAVWRAAAPWRYLLVGLAAAAGLSTVYIWFASVPHKLYKAGKAVLTRGEYNFTPNFLPGRVDFSRFSRQSTIQMPPQFAATTPTYSQSRGPIA